MKLHMLYDIVFFEMILHILKNRYTVYYFLSYNIKYIENKKYILECESNYIILFSIILNYILYMIY